MSLKRVRLKGKSSNSPPCRNRNLRKQSLSTEVISSNQKQTLIRLEGNHHSAELGETVKMDRQEEPMPIMEPAASHLAAVVLASFPRTGDLAKRSHQTSTASRQTETETIWAAEMVASTTKHQ